MIARKQPPSCSDRRYTRMIREMLGSMNAKREPGRKWNEQQLRSARYKELVYGRRALWSELRQLGFSYPSIARVSGHDHTTILFGVIKYQALSAQIRRKMDRRIGICPLLDRTNTIHTADTCTSQTDHVLPDSSHHNLADLDTNIAA